MQPEGQHLLDLARALARVVHAGQSRKGTGEPYFNHVDRVAARVEGWRAKTIAYLHDTVEDTPLGPFALAAMGFPRDLVDDVLALSRWEMETYAAFIDRTIRDGSDDALRVKLADLQDNLADPWVKTTDLESRYLPAVAKVAVALAERRQPAANAA